MVDWVSFVLLPCNVELLGGRQSTPQILFHLSFYLLLQVTTILFQLPFYLLLQVMTLFSKAAPLDITCRIWDLLIR